MPKQEKYHLFHFFSISSQAELQKNEERVWSIFSSMVGRCYKRLSHYSNKWHFFRAEKAPRKSRENQITHTHLWTGRLIQTTDFWKLYGENTCKKTQHFGPKKLHIYKPINIASYELTNELHVHEGLTDTQITPQFARIWVAGKICPVYWRTTFTLIMTTVRKMLTVSSTKRGISQNMKSVIIALRCESRLYCHFY